MSVTSLLALICISNRVSQDHLDLLDLLDLKVNLDCLDMMEFREDQVILETMVNLDNLVILALLVPLASQDKRVNVEPVDNLLEWAWE